jgi:hypothetical protein
MTMDKKQARRNLLLAAILITASALITLFGLGFIRFFMMLPR